MNKWDSIKLMNISRVIQLARTVEWVIYLAKDSIILIKGKINRSVLRPRTGRTFSEGVSIWGFDLG